MKNLLILKMMLKKSKFYIYLTFDKYNFLIRVLHPPTNISFNEYPTEHTEINTLLKERELQCKV